MMKYRAWPAIPEIQAEEVTRETEKFVVLENGQRWAKRADGWAYFDTYEEARKFVIRQIEGKIDKCLADIDRLNVNLNKVREMMKCKSQ